MKELWDWAKTKLYVDRRLILICGLMYALWGLGMNWFGIQMEIPNFTFWWQMVTCYLLYIVPVSLLPRNLPFHG